MKPPPLTWRDLVIALVILALTLLGTVWPSHDQVGPDCAINRASSQRPSHLDRATQ